MIPLPTSKTCHFVPVSSRSVDKFTHPSPVLPLSHAFTSPTDFSATTPLLISNTCHFVLSERIDDKSTELSLALLCSQRGPSTTPKFFKATISPSFNIDKDDIDIVLVQVMIGLFVGEDVVPINEA